MKKAFDLTMEHGPDGRLLGKTERTPNREFTYAYEYDDAGRLAKVLRDGMLSEMYVYDNEGRRWSETNAFRRLYDRRMRYGAGNRLLACGQAGYVHGESGFREARQSPDGETHYYYAGDGRLLDADLPDGRQIAFRHDQADRRVRKLVNGVTAEEYEWLDRIRLGAAIIDGLPMQFHYEQGRLPVAATIGDALVSLFYDQVGSLRVVADRYGNMIQEIVYDSFGNVLENTNPGLRLPIDFAGGLHDPDIGFVRFGFRDYDPDTGRFTALDPIGPLGGDPDEYGYCLDDPVNGIDPVGLMSLLTPDKLARKAHKIINPMSTERIITELADEEIERIKTEYGEDNATIERLEGLKQHMEEKGLPSAPEAIKMTMEKKGVWPFEKKSAQQRKGGLGR